MLWWISWNLNKLLFYHQISTYSVKEVINKLMKCFQNEFFITKIYIHYNLNRLNMWEFHKKKKKKKELSMKWNLWFINVQKC